MHKHDETCGWIHEQFPNWGGCLLMAECTNEAVPRVMWSTDGSRRYRMATDVCDAHVADMAERFGAYRVDTLCPDCGQPEPVCDCVEQEQAAVV